MVTEKSVQRNTMARPWRLNVVTPNGWIRAISVGATKTVRKRDATAWIVRSGRAPMDWSRRDWRANAAHNAWTLISNGKGIKDDNNEIFANFCHNYNKKI